MINLPHLPLMAPAEDQSNFTLHFIGEGIFFLVDIVYIKIEVEGAIQVVPCRFKLPYGRLSPPETELDGRLLRFIGSDAMVPKARCKWSRASSHAYAVSAYSPASRV
jgi:hypothetical protein